MERFWNKVSVRTKDECWPWMAHRSDRGYGIFWLDGKNVRAHRVALELETGENPQDLLALHSCDNPPCCNPSHLRWGTLQDNSDDMTLRKRHSFGERSPSAKITDEIASLIMRKRVDGMKVDEIAGELSIGRETVMNVYTGVTWRHLHGVNGNPTFEELKSSKPKNRAPSAKRVLTNEMVDRILTGRMEGLTAKELATELGVAEGTVSPVFSGISYTERLGTNGNPTKEQLVAAKSFANVRLTEDDLVEIKALLAQGYTGASVAEKLGVGKATISRVKNGTYSPSRLL